MDESLWPSRGVAEHAYCPRLFYYMTVEGVFIPSADTEHGAGVHEEPRQKDGVIDVIVTSEALAPQEDGIRGAAAVNNYGDQKTGARS